MTQTKIEEKSFVRLASKLRVSFYKTAEVNDNDLNEKHELERAFIKKYPRDIYEAKAFLREFVRSVYDTYYKP